MEVKLLQRAIMEPTSAGENKKNHTQNLDNKRSEKETVKVVNSGTKSCRRTPCVVRGRPCLLEWTQGDSRLVKWSDQDNNQELECISETLCPQGLVQNSVLLKRLLNDLQQFPCINCFFVNSINIIIIIICVPTLYNSRSTSTDSYYLISTYIFLLSGKNQTWVLSPAFGYDYKLFRKRSSIYLISHCITECLWCSRKLNFKLFN